MRVCEDIRGTWITDLGVVTTNNKRFLQRTAGVNHIRHQQLRNLIDAHAGPEQHPQNSDVTHAQVSATGHPHDVI